MITHWKTLARKIAKKIGIHMGTIIKTTLVMTSGIAGGLHKAL